MIVIARPIIVQYQELNNNFVSIIDSIVLPNLLSLNISICIYNFRNMILLKSITNIVFLILKYFL